MVRLLSARGPIDRVVVDSFDGVLSIATVEEWEASRMEGRKPRTVGFRQRDVIECLPDYAAPSPTKEGSR
jgi:hypothetical protein